MGGPKFQARPELAPSLFCRGPRTGTGVVFVNSSQPLGKVETLNPCVDSKPCPHQRTHFAQAPTALQWGS